jgi:hypothetical protein
MGQAALFGDYPTPNARPVHGRFMRLLALSLAFVCALCAVNAAQAQITINANQSVGAVPGFAGTGLFGLYFLDPQGGNGFNNPDLSQPLASFMTTNLCFPDCLSGNSFVDSSGGLAAFTNGNATNIVNLSGSPLPTDWNSASLFINGYIAINQAGTYDFNILTDNDSQLFIGGTFIGGVQGCCGPDNETVNFAAAGLYAIAFNFLEYGGQSGLDLTATDPTSTCILGCYVGNALQPNGLFYSDSQLQGAPAPLPGAGWPSALAALGVLAVAMRRRMAGTIGYRGVR